MRWQVLKPLSATGFLLRDGAGAGRDVLIDMEGEPDLRGALAAAGSSFARIAQLLVTHFHADHFHVSEALEMARGGTRIHMGRGSWQSLDEFLAARPQAAKTRETCRELERSGALDLVDPAGERALGDLPLSWAAFGHGDGDLVCENLAFRAGDHLFTGDTSARSMFDASNASAMKLLGLPAGGAVRVFCVNVAQLTREEIPKLPDLSPRRVRNYLFNHGILEDLLAAVADPAFAPFFRGLEWIVPHHLRHEPLAGMAAIVAGKLVDAGAKAGCRFQVAFPGARIGT